MRRLILAALPAALLMLSGPVQAATSPEAKACSDEATAKGLHGAEREAFRDSCMKGAAPAAKPVPVAAKAAPATPAPSAGGGTAASKACSDQATARGLHGADREAFRASCMKGAPAPMVAAKPAPAAAPRPAPVAAPKPAPVAVPKSAPTPPAAGAAARSPMSQACSDQATAKGLHGADRETFRADCMKGPAAVAKPVARAAPAPAPARPAAEPVPPEPRAAAAKPAAASATPAGARSPAQLAADRRIHDCGQQWQAAKAANRIPAGQTWPQYWSACSARMKAAGK